MLVLTPREGEVLQLGADIKIHVKKVKGNSVRLAIEAPNHVRISRIASPERGGFTDDEDELPIQPAVRKG